MAKSASPGRSDAALSIVGADLRIEGELTSEGVIKVEGTVVGTVRAAHQVLVARGGAIEGDVHTREAIVAGGVHGSVFAAERVEVQEGAVVNGDIVTKRLAVMEGGEVNGHVRMRDARPVQQGDRLASALESRAAS